MKTRKALFVGGVGATLLVWAASTYSAEYDAVVRAGLGVSDNIARSSTLEVDETIATFGFDLGVTESTRRLELQLQASMDYLDYLDGTFDAEWVGGLNGVAIINLIEDRLDWEFRNSFGQQLIDPLSPSRPGNRENVNFLTTGPTWRLFSTTRNPVRLEARYSRLDYEERPFDNDRLSGLLSIGRSTSRETTVSLNISAERIEFDNDSISPPIDRREAYIQFAKIGLRNTVSIDLGYNEVEYAGEEGDGTLARIRWTRETSPNGTLTLTGGTRYSDQGNIFRLYQDITNDLSETVDTPETTAPFQNDFIALRHAIDTGRFTVDLSCDWSKDDYQGGAGLDREISRASARFQRDISRTVLGGLNLRFVRRDYQGLSRNDDDLIMGANIGYRLSPGMSLTFDYQHSRRSSSDRAAEFTENRAFLRISYVPVWGR